jgi:hypothetical protein
MVAVTGKKSWFSCVHDGRCHSVARSERFAGGSQESCASVVTGCVVVYERSRDHFVSNGAGQPLTLMGTSVRDSARLRIHEVP